MRQAKASWMVFGGLGLMLSACAPSVAGGAFKVTTLNAHTLQLTGEITAASVKLVEDALAVGGIDTLRVNSNGGDGESGIKIGDMILDHKLALIIGPKCGSSCANYLLTAASNVTYEPGAAVIYHGDLQSSLEYFNTWAAETAKKYPEDQRPSIIGTFPRLAKAEAEFYQKIPTHKVHALNLFITCLSKGELIFSYWLADATTLSYFGLPSQGYKPSSLATITPGMFTTDQVPEAKRAACLSSDPPESPPHPS
jgi:hypothetical protein